LRGTRSNRDGIGARVSVLAGDRKQIDEVRSGGSYLSQNDLCLHFGIGDMKRVDEVEVRWPSGAVDRIKDVLANQRLFVEEGRGLLRAVRLALTSPSRNHSQ